LTCLIAVPVMTCLVPVPVLTDSIQLCLSVRVGFHGFYHDAAKSSSYSPATIQLQYSYSPATAPATVQLQSR
jgi:hypothetical protein